MDLNKMTVAQLKKKCNDLEISLTKSNGNQKLKKDLVSSLERKLNNIHLGGKKSRRRSKSKSRSKSRRRSKSKSRRRSKSKSRRKSRKASCKSKSRKGNRKSKCISMSGGASSTSYKQATFDKSKVYFSLSFLVEGSKLIIPDILAKNVVDYYTSGRVNKINIKYFKELTIMEGTVTDYYTTAPSVTSKLYKEGKSTFAVQWKEWKGNTTVEGIFDGFLYLSSPLNNENDFEVKTSHDTPFGLISKPAGEIQSYLDTVNFILTHRSIYIRQK